MCIAIMLDFTYPIKDCENLSWRFTLGLLGANWLPNQGVAAWQNHMNQEAIEGQQEAQL